MELIATLQAKGCNRYTQIIKLSYDEKIDLQHRQDRWDFLLGSPPKYKVGKLFLESSLQKFKVFIFWHVLQAYPIPNKQSNAHCPFF